MNRVTLFLHDALERAGWSAGQAAFALLIAGGAVTDVVGLPWWAMVVAGITAFVVSFLTTGVQYLFSLENLSFWVDLPVRAAKTFGAVLIAALSVNGVNLLSLDWKAAINLAGVAALTVVAKSFLARIAGTGTSFKMVKNQPVEIHTASTSPVVRQSVS